MIPRPKPASCQESIPSRKTWGTSSPGRSWRSATVAPPGLRPMREAGQRVAVRLLTVPPAAISAQAEPLVVTGETGRGDILYLRQVGGGAWLWATITGAEVVRRVSPRRLTLRRRKVSPCKWVLCLRPGRAPRRTIRPGAGCRWSGMERKSLKGSLIFIRRRPPRFIWDRIRSAARPRPGISPGT